MSRNIIAILRGVRPCEVVEIAGTLLGCGITKIEVPLNSPDPFESIAAIVQEFDDQALIGAGTVLTVSDVKRTCDVGGKFVVSPNCDPEVIAATKTAGLLSYPGVMTPSECFLALRLGADGLKFFPSNLIGLYSYKLKKIVAILSVLAMFVVAVALFATRQTQTKLELLQRTNKELLTVFVENLDTFNNNLLKMQKHLKI